MSKIQGRTKDVDHIKKIQGFVKNSDRCCGNCFNVLYDHEKKIYSCEIGYFNVEVPDCCNEWILAEN